MKKVSGFSIPNEDISSYTTSSVEIAKDRREIIHLPAQTMN
jgi:hypothetical protein